MCFLVCILSSWKPFSISYIILYQWKWLKTDSKWLHKSGWNDCIGILVKKYFKTSIHLQGSVSLSWPWTCDPWVLPAALQCAEHITEASLSVCTLTLLFWMSRRMCSKQLLFRKMACSTGRSGHCRISGMASTAEYSVINIYRFVLNRTCIEALVKTFFSFFFFFFVKVS